MEIREDFEFNPDSWKAEAKVLLKKTMHVILYVCLLIPFFFMYLHNFLISNLSKLDIGVVFQSFIAAITMSVLMILIAAPGFYILYFVKKIDFGVKVGPLAVIKGIKEVFSKYIVFAKGYKSFMLIFNSIIFLLVFTSFYVNSNNGTLDKILQEFSFIRILYDTSTMIAISLLWILCIAHKRILGIVYIAYDMVDSEGAEILTTNACLKFPALQNYIRVKSAMINMCFILLLFFKMFGSLISIGLSIKYGFYAAINFAFVVYCCYELTIIYIISRDLYGGKQQKQTVTLEKEIENVIPSLL